MSGSVFLIFLLTFLNIMIINKIMILIKTIIDPVGTFKLKLITKPNKTEISEKMIARIIEFLNESPTKILEATGKIIKAEISRTPIISIKIEMNKARVMVIINCNALTLIPDNFA